MESLIPVATALISGGCAAVAAIVVAVIQHKKTDALLEYRLRELEEKVDKHNNLIERTYELEKYSAVQQRELKSVAHRVADLEKKECQNTAKNIV